jgi:hypothetical protein
MTKNLRITTLLYILLTVTISFAEVKLNFEGNADIGISLAYLQNSEGENRYDRFSRIGSIQLGSKAKIEDNLGIKFKVEFDNKFHTMKLQNLYISYKWNKSNLRFGYMKKRFTIEESNNRDKRVFIKRSLVNDYLSSYNLMERDLTLQYRNKSKNSKRSRNLYSALSLDGTGRYIAVVNGELKKKRRLLNLAVLYANTQARSASEPSSFFATLGGELSSKKVKNELEFTFGTNPELRMIAISLGKDEKIFFGGSRFQQHIIVPTNLKRLKSTNLFWEVAVCNDDIRNNYVTGQFRPGFSLNFGKKDNFRWINSGDFRISSREDTRKSVSLYRFDITSEVIVLW